METNIYIEVLLFYQMLMNAKLAAMIASICVIIPLVDIHVIVLMATDWSMIDSASVSTKCTQHFLFSPKCINK